MRFRASLLASIVLAGCSQNSQQGPVAASTVDLLKEGSAKACIADDVRDTLFAMVTPTVSADGEWTEADVATGKANVNYKLDLITQSGSDRSISSVSCEANFIVSSKGNGEQTFPIQYEIRPSAEDPAQFIIKSNILQASDFAKRLTMFEIEDASNDRMKAEAAKQAEGEPANSASQPGKDDNLDCEGEWDPNSNTITRPEGCGGSDSEPSDAATPTNLLPSPSPTPPPLQIQTVKTPGAVISLTPSAPQDDNERQ